MRFNAFKRKVRKEKFTQSFAELNQLILITPFSKRTLAFLITAAYGVSLLWLTSIWYTSYTNFHFFDDLFEWEYIDKLGHFFASFQLSLYFYKTFGDQQNLNPSLRKKWICFAGFA